MPGGFRLTFFALTAVFIFAIAVLADDAASKGSGTSGPPVAPMKPVEEQVQGHKIVDPYRWLEDANSTETKQWVSEQDGYTRRLN